MKKLILVVCSAVLLFIISGCGCIESAKPEGFAERRQIGTNQEEDSVIGAALSSSFEMKGVCYGTKA